MDQSFVPSSDIGSVRSARPSFGLTTQDPTLPPWLITRNCGDMEHFWIHMCRVRFGFGLLRWISGQTRPNTSNFAPPQSENPKPNRNSAYDETVPRTISPCPGSLHRFQALALFNMHILLDAYFYDGCSCFTTYSSRLHLHANWQHPLFQPM